MNITYLTPTWSKATTGKTYRLVDGTPTKTNDYQLGETHAWKVDRVIDTPEALCHSLRQFGKTSIRIVGAPRQDMLDMGLLEPGGTCLRRLSYFEEPPDGVSVLYLDLDNVEAVAPFEFTNRASSGAAIQKIFATAGLDLLARTKFVVLLTSSQWSNARISAHCYWVLSKPVHLDELTNWATAHNKVAGVSLLDPVSFRTVQPDYITARRCEGFTDPLDEYHRLFVHGDGPAQLDTDAFRVHMAATMSNAGWTPTQAKKQAQDSIGRSWDRTLALCGTNNRGVNEFAFRAAAQLVQQYGRNRVKADMQHYAETMHRMTWEAYHANEPSGRDYAKDIKTYDLARFRQYLTSALEKFGASTDANELILTQAIDEARLGKVRLLYEPQVLAAAQHVMTHDAGAWAELSGIIKKDLKGQVSITDWKKKVAMSLADTAAGTDISLSRVGGTFNENLFIDPVLESFDWIIDQHGSRWASIASRAGDGGHKLIPMGDAVSALYTRGLELSGHLISDRFGRKALAKLFGAEDLGSNEERFRPRTTGFRVQAADESDLLSPTWIDLGKQPDGKYLCAKIDIDGVTYPSRKDSPILWRDGEKAAPAVVASMDRILKRFGTTENLIEWTRERMLTKYLSCHSASRGQFMAWILTVMLGRGMSPVCEILGPQHSGKTTQAGFAVDLVDPRATPLAGGGSVSSIQGMPHRDIFTTVEQRYITVFDNMSGLSDERQNILCQIATGTGRSERMLYTNGKTFSIYVRRPVITTSINDIITHNDLISRRIQIRCVTDTFNTPSLTLFRDWYADLPYLRAGFHWMLVDYYRNTKDALEENRNMRGYEARRFFLSQTERAALGHELSPSESFALRNQDAIESVMNSRFAMAFLAFLRGRTEWIGQILDLFNQYQEFLFDNAGKLLTVTVAGEPLQFKLNANDAMLRNTRTFAQKLNQYQYELEVISGWDLSNRIRKASGIHIHLINKHADLDITPDFM